MPSRTAALIVSLTLAVGVFASEVPPAVTPFAPAPSPASSPPAATGNPRWELVGIMGTREAPTVRIRDTVENAASWVRVGETFGTVKVVAADLDANTATVQTGNDRIVLGLRVNGVTPGAAVASPTANAAPAAPAALPSTGDPAADARRDQAIAEREARMLVSDLLEISVIQRQAYEEKQAAAAKAAAEGAR